MPLTLSLSSSLPTLATLALPAESAMKEACRAGRQAGWDPLSLAPESRGTLPLPFCHFPHAPISWGMLQRSGCNLGQDAKSLAINTT